jgi:hypothetical protein
VAFRLDRYFPLHASLSLSNLYITHAHANIGFIKAQLINLLQFRKLLSVLTLHTCNIITKNSIVNSGLGPQGLFRKLKFNLQSIV